MRHGHAISCILEHTTAKELFGVMMRYCLAGLVLLVMAWSAGLVQGAHNGIPNWDPPYGSDVETWWYSHPFNPDSSAYDPIITSPTNSTTLNSGASIQTAINTLDSQGGGTIYLNDGSYGDFDLTSTNNIHMIATGNSAIVSGFSRMAVISRMHDYGDFNACFVYNESECVNAMENPNKNFYFKDIIFDGGGTTYYSMLIQRSRDWLFENCTYQNFYDPGDNHRGVISGHMGPVNGWFVNCNFIGDERWGTYFDGMHGSGWVQNYFSNDFGSGTMLFLTNDDFSEDFDNDGWESHEQLNPQYLIIYENTFSGTYNPIDYNQAGHSLVMNNISTGNSYRFLYATDRCSQRHSNLYYEGFGNKIIANTITTATYFYDLNARRYNCTQGSNYGKIGNYELRCNRTGAITSLVHETNPSWIYDSETVVTGNCVNDPGCTTSSCGQQGMPSVIPPEFSPSAGTYASSVQVTITCGTSGATIRYTTNGSDPTETSTQYTAPITLTSTTTLKARGFKTDMNDSQVTSGVYTIDVTAPSVPTGLSAGTITDDSVLLTWTASTDDTGVAGYNVYRDTVLQGSTANTSYQQLGLAHYTAYSYTVSAFDGAARESTQSSPLVVTTEMTADIDDDGSVDGVDLNEMAANWLSSSGGNADINRDAIVNLDDFSVLTAEWGNSSGTGPYQQDSGTQGIVCIEAEHYSAETDNGSGDHWTLVTSPTGYTGEGNMQVLPDDGDQVNTGYDTASPQLDFEVNFVKTGTHYLWVRGSGPDSSGDSCHMGLDGSAVSSAEYIDLEETTGSLEWGGGTSKTLDITSTGLHTVNLWMREDGVIVDKIVISTDSGYTPSGAGPAESPR